MRESSGSDTLTSIIRKVCVLGAGVMGQGISAHLANSGIKCLLLDIPSNGKDKSAFAKTAIEKIKNSKPSLCFDTSLLSYITPGNIEDDLDKIKECDLIIEAVLEDVKVKQKVFNQIRPYIKPQAIIASNTSGLSIESMLDGLDSDFRSRFLVMHFFNPVRYLHLVEVVPGKETRHSVIEKIKNFAEKTLGKGVVVGKNTPNFVANRIGVYGMMESLAALKNYKIEEIDAIFGPILGRPKSAVFRTADVVGLDTFIHVANNCYDHLKNDECNDIFKIPAFLSQMVKNGWLGQKSGQGFYKKSGADILSIDPATLEYHKVEKPKFTSLGEARKLSSLNEKIHHVAYSDDRAGKLFFLLASKICIYAANRLYEIADNILDIDNALMWGFGWEYGPFKTWDALGLRKSVGAMKELGLTIPSFVEEMLKNGVETFYKEDQYYSPKDKSYINIAKNKKEICFDKIKQTNLVTDSDAYSLFGTSEDVLVVEFHTKMNAIDNEILDGINKAIDICEEGKFKALLLANNGENFSVGANLFLLYMAASQGMWDDIEKIVKLFQSTSRRLKYSSIPTVSAPFKLTLGGGCELSMWCDAIHAQAETYVGLVEVGVGLLPGGGGNIEMLARTLSGAIDSPSFVTEHMIQRALETVAMAKVATSAAEAKRLLYFNEKDTFSMNDRFFFKEAITKAAMMADCGYVSPKEREFRLPGKNAYATFAMGLMPMLQGGFISEHDHKIALKVAHVMTGGNTNSYQKVSEEYLLDLEREAFLSLLSEPKTMERIAYMLEHNKPLRN